MASRLIHPILHWIARKTDAQLAPTVEFLQAENAILQSMLPKQIRVKPADKKRLLQVGAGLGPALKLIITIVTYTTFLHWQRVSAGGRKSKPVGRPKTEESVEALVVQIASQTDWGYTRILGELKKLGVRAVCRSTVKNIMVRHGFDPGPKRGPGTWSDFIERHARTLWACDFLSKKIWTKFGLVEYFALFFIHVGTLRVYLADVTANPTGAWVAQQARNFVMHLEETPEYLESGEQQFFLIHDHDVKLTAQFRRIFKDAGVKPVRTAIGAPVLNGYAERWVQSFRRECLDHFVVLGEGHFRHLAREYVDWYNTVRPHQSLGNRPIGEPARHKPAPPGRGPGILCESRCGGLLKHYYSNAA